MIREALEAELPPASCVIVSAKSPVLGFRTVRTKSGDVTVTRASPTI